MQASRDQRGPLTIRQAGHVRHEGGFDVSLSQSMLVFSIGAFGFRGMLVGTCTGPVITDRAQQRYFHASARVGVSSQSTDFKLQPDDGSVRRVPQSAAGYTLTQEDERPFRGDGLASG